MKMTTTERQRTGAARFEHAVSLVEAGMPKNQACREAGIKWPMALSRYLRNNRPDLLGAGTGPRPNAKNRWHAQEQSVDELEFLKRRLSHVSLQASESRRRADELTALERRLAAAVAALTVSEES